MGKTIKFEELVSTYYQVLNDSDKVILTYINENKEKISSYGIEKVAKECAVSRSTIMRFAQKLHLNGYAELKTLLKWDLLPAEEKSSNIVDDICNVNINVIENFRNLDCTGICESLYKANRIFVYGTGSIQKNACVEFKRILLTLGYIINTISGESEFMKTIKLMNSRDVMFIISQTGNSQLLQSACNQLSSKGIKIISLTFSGNNYLANHSDYKIFLQPEEITVYSHNSFKSITMIFIIVELLGAKFIIYLKEQKRLLEVV